MSIIDLFAEKEGLLIKNQVRFLKYCMLSFLRAL